MHKFFKTLNLLLMIIFCISACSLQAVQAQPGAQSVPTGISYQVLLGKSANDADVIKFIASNNCVLIGPLEACKEKGLAIWIDSTQIVKTIYLYSGGEDGFNRYHGKLPFDLTFYDPMSLVEDKLKKFETSDTLQQAGLPDAGSTPDHIHYWAVYKRFGIAVLYDEPFADEDGYIYAILVNA